MQAPARINRVDVGIDPESQVPQLVVTLCYEEEAQAAEPTPMPIEAKETTPGPAVIDDDGQDPGEPPDLLPVPVIAAKRGPDGDLKSIKKASDEMKGAVARTTSKVTPALLTFLRRAKITFALLTAKRMGDGGSVPILLRRTTSPPPGGGLHASGRRVVRGESMADAKEAAPPSLTPAVLRRRVAIGALAAVAAVLVVTAMRKPAVGPGTASAAAASEPLPTEPSPPPMPRPPPSP